MLTIGQKLDWSLISFIVSLVIMLLQIYIISSIAVFFFFVSWISVGYYIMYLIKKEKHSLVDYFVLLIFGVIAWLGAFLALVRMELFLEDKKK